MLSLCFSTRPLANSSWKVYSLCGCQRYYPNLRGTWLHNTQVFHRTHQLPHTHRITSQPKVPCVFLHIFQTLGTSSNCLRVSLRRPFGRGPAKTLKSSHPVMSDFCLNSHERPSMFLNSQEFSKKGEGFSPSGKTWSQCFFFFFFVIMLRFLERNAKRRREDH